MRHSPVPMTARGSTRFDTDFDPGTRTEPERGPEGTGVIHGEQIILTISASTDEAFGSAACGRDSDFVCGGWQLLYDVLTPCETSLVCMF